MADLASSSMAHNSAHAIMSTQQQHNMDLHLRNGEVSVLNYVLWTKNNKIFVVEKDWCSLWVFQV